MLGNFIRKKSNFLLAGMLLMPRSPFYMFGSGGQEKPLFTGRPDSEPNQKDKAIKSFDVAVIGGGSAGIAFSFEANRQGLNTVIFDYVKETPHGTKWGIGGTCVNVGCIPKKLIHQAALLGQAIKNSSDYGWNLGVNSKEQVSKLTEKFSWQTLINKINNYVRSLNFGYKNNLGKSGITYINQMATFIDKQTILCSKDKSVIEEYLSSGKLPENGLGQQYQIIKAKAIVVATGTRPTYLSQSQCRGSKLAITSDDIFWMQKPPGRTLIVGGGYVAVEIAGFLTELGFKVSLMTRGEYLRSFDRDMVGMVMSDLEERGVNIIQTSLPTSIDKDTETGQLNVKVQNTIDKSQKDLKVDTVLFAVGRSATTKSLNVDRVGLQVSSINGKIITDKKVKDVTNLPNVYALGDVVDGVPQLTSTAQKAATLLARRIASDLGVAPLQKKQYNDTIMDYKDYPTTIFTPLEYSVCGMSQEQAIKKYGLENIEVYHSRTVPLEEAILDKYDEEGNDKKIRAYFKVITDKAGNVVGMHYAGPNAGEVMQGYAVAMKVGLTYERLVRTVGIHPTVAEEFVNVKVTKSSGESPEKGGC